MPHLPSSCPPLSISSSCSIGSYFGTACSPDNTLQLCKYSRGVFWCFAWKTTCSLRTYLRRSVCRWNDPRIPRRFPCPNFLLQHYRYFTFSTADWSDLEACASNDLALLLRPLNLYMYSVCTFEASKNMAHVTLRGFINDWLAGRIINIETCVDSPALFFFSFYPLNIYTMSVLQTKPALTHKETAF